MWSKLKPKTEFTKNVLTLMTGTTIAQAIPIAISPILTRLYTPEDFGVFALFSSSVTILSIIIGGRYENAILLPKLKKEVYLVSIVSLIIGFVFMLSIFIFLFLCENFFNNTNVNSLGSYLYLIPITAFLILIYQILYNINNKNKQYKKISAVKISQSLFSAISNISLGFAKIGASGLIISQIFSYFISIFLFKKEIRTLLSHLKSVFSIKSKSKILYILKKYKKFPIFDVPTSFLNSLSFQLPIYLLGFYFNPAVVGFFVFSRRIVGLPIVLLSSSIITVFKQSAIEEYYKKGNCINIYIKTLKKLILISFLPFLILFFIAPDLFAIVFGEKWRIAGEYTQILIPMFFMRFISSPLSYMFYIVNKQNLNMFINVLLVLGIVISIYLGYKLDNVQIALFLYAFVYIIFYVTYLIISYKFAKGKVK